jgi:hypothetical protein
MFSYVSSANMTFLLNTAQLSQAQAEVACQQRGGHLAAFLTAAEQQEVQGWFAAAGHLLSSFHRSFWLGLQTESLLPRQFK